MEFKGTAKMEDYKRILMELKRLLSEDYAALNRVPVMGMDFETVEAYMRRRDKVRKLYSAVDNFLSRKGESAFTDQGAWNCRRG